MQNEEWNYAGGCSWKHPFNKANRDACNEAVAEKKDTKNYVSRSQAESDMILAQAAAAASMKKEDKWSAGQTLMVVGGALTLLTIMTIVIIKMKKSK